MLGFGKRSAAITRTPAEVRDLLAKGAITLVDVREDGEWAQERIPGAIHHPLSRLGQSAASIPAAKPVVFHCLAGSRSAQAVALCEKLGLPHDSHMGGGLSAWKAHGLPVSR